MCQMRIQVFHYSHQMESIVLCNYCQLTLRFSVISLKRNIALFIIKVFRTIVFIFIVISTTFQPISFEEGRRTYWPKRCGNNNKDEDNSPKNLNDKNQQASSQKFRQLSIAMLGNDSHP